MKRSTILGCAAALLTMGLTATAAPDDEGCPMMGGKPAGQMRMDAGMPGKPMMGGEKCPMMGKGREQMGSEQRPMMGKADKRHKAMFMPKAPMNEDEMAKFTDLSEKVRFAMEDYRADGTEANQAALKTALTNLIGAAQQFEVERCEKALARAKAKMQEKDAMVERMMKKITAPRPEKPGKPGRPAPAPMHAEK